jgi:hypothetical protein
MPWDHAQGGAAAMNIATPVESPLIQQFNEIMPLAFSSASIGATGLVIVDEVNGFATVGAGYLAPPAPNAQVTRMIAETDRLARAFTAGKRPILAFLDTHVPGKAEPPYPPHCEAGTGQENLVPALEWLEKDPNTTLVRKDHASGQQPRGRLGQREAARRDPGGRDLHGYLCHGFRADHALGPQPRHDADLEGDPGL